MIPIVQSQEHLASAREALFEADLALAQRDTRRVTIQLDLAQAYLGEIRKLLRPAPGTTLPAPSSP